MGMLGAVFLAHVSLVESENGIFEGVRLFGVDCLLGLHGCDGYCMGGLEKFVIVFGVGFDPLGEEVFGDCVLYVLGVRFFIYDPTSGLVYGFCIGFPGEFSYQGSGLGDGFLIFEHHVESQVIMENAARNLAMRPGGSDCGKQQQWGEG